ncbi:hypothetical protein [Streptomyces cyaneofuscatus]|uniref:hypothetical protein n=1 Tax=Streptomyces cyaneofuscatus TaxID=66883 RepID=UPI003AF2C2DD
MATEHTSPAQPAPASSPAYPMAKPGYGKRAASDQRPRTPHDFSLLPTRERYVAGFIDCLPDEAAMGVKTLAQQLPLYGQQAIGSALRALSVAGHLRRVRCAVGREGQVRWVSRTFWSRTARDNEWWNAYLATERARFTAGTEQARLRPLPLPLLPRRRGCRSRRTPVTSTLTPKPTPYPYRSNGRRRPQRSHRHPPRNHLTHRAPPPPTSRSPSSGR